MATPFEALASLDVSAPKRFSLAGANEQRPAALFENLFATLYACCQAVAPGHGFRFKNPLFSVDSPTISLCLQLFPWSRDRTAKGTIEVDTILDPAGYPREKGPIYPHVLRWVRYGDPETGYHSVF